MNGCGKGAWKLATKDTLCCGFRGNNAGNVVSWGGNVAGLGGVYLLVDLSQFFEGCIQILADYITVNGCGSDAAVSQLFLNKT
jgi:hypothetical protein